MNEFSPYNLLSIDLPALLTALFASFACALPGNFLLLRRQSLMGDAISHAVLPGIVMAFLLTSSRAAWPIFLGAIAAGVLCALIVELIRNVGRLESGAAMGVVFPVFFAGGVLMMEQAAARNVDLDADCLLNGQLESIFWFPPHTLSAFFSLDTLWLIPGELQTSLFVFVLCALLMALFYKELKIASFDPTLASALGFKASYVHLGLMTLIAAAIVASFKAVGSILVVAMIICPPASARLLTDKLGQQIRLSLLIAAIAVIGGYAGAVLLPWSLGYRHSLSAAGMMAVACGLCLGLTALFAPRYGLLARKWRAFCFELQVLGEDVLGFLYRAEELSAAQINRIDIKAALKGRLLLDYVLWQLVNSKDVACSGGVCHLLDSGRVRARGLLRSHRLWESYLVDTLGLRADHVHERAERLEHFTSQNMQQTLADDTGTASHDPHGKPIPD